MGAILVSLFSSAPIVLLVLGVCIFVLLLICLCFPERARVLIQLIKACSCLLHPSQANEGFEVNDEEPYSLHWLRRLTASEAELARLNQSTPFVQDEPLHTRHQKNGNRMHRRSRNKSAPRTPVYQDDTSGLGTTYQQGYRGTKSPKSKVRNNNAQHIERRKSKGQRNSQHGREQSYRHSSHRSRYDH